MRSDTIIIGGQSYEVKGLSVSQSLKEDIIAADANGGKDADAKVQARLRRVAISLQNADAYLPDPNNSKGQISVKCLPVEQVIAILDGDLFLDAAEYYEAETVVMKLTGFLKSESKDGTKGDQPQAAGELVATA